MRFIYIFFTFFTLLAQAENAAFKVPVYGGSGCPKNKTLAVLSPDGSALSIIFSDYIVLAGGTTHRSFTQKNCAIQIPIEIPFGLQLGIIGADYRGFNDLPCNTKSTLAVEYAFSKSTSARYTKTFMGPIKGENYLVRHKLTARTPIQSECGTSSTLNIKSFINVQTDSVKNPTMSAIDSLDIALNGIPQSGITLYFEWLPCS